MAELDRLRQILSEQLGINPLEINTDTTIEDLGVDSLDMVEALMNIEEEFEIEIDTDEAENFKTVGDLLDYITK